MSDDEKLTVEDLRVAVKQLKEVSTPIVSLPMRNDIRLTVDGVVSVPGIGWIHPESFKDACGQEAYDYLLTLPRVSSPFPDSEIK